jgi:chlorite dismutase
METPLGKMLDRAQEYVDSMAHFFADFRDRATDDYSRLLTYHIARHKKSLSLLHSMLSPEELGRVRTTPLKTGDDDFLPERVFNSYYLVSESKPSEVIATAIDFLEVLVGFYQWLDDQFQGMPISKVLKELIEKEGKEIEKLRSIETESFFENRTRNKSH